MKINYEILTEELNGVECSIYASNGDTTCWVWSIDHESGHEIFDNPQEAIQDLKNWLSETKLSAKNKRKITEYTI